MESKKRPRTASADSGHGSSASSPTHPFPDFKAAKLARTERHQVSALFTPDEVRESEKERAERKEKDKRREERRRREKEDEEKRKKEKLEKEKKEKLEKEKKEKLEKEKKKWQLVSIWQPDVRKHRKHTTIEGSLNPMISSAYANRYFSFNQNEKIGIAFYVARDPIKNLVKIRAFDVRPDLIFERSLAYSLEVYRITGQGKKHTVLERENIGTNDITILPEQLHKNALFGYIIRVKIKPLD